jgi:hypothetical protein
VRFGVRWQCVHYDPKTKGGAYPLLLEIGGKVDIRLDNNGVWWSTDVPTDLLGRHRGKNVILQALVKVNGKDARGLTYDAYLKRTTSAHTQTIAEWYIG